MRSSASLLPGAAGAVGLAGEKGLLGRPGCTEPECSGGGGSWGGRFLRGGEGAKPLGALRRRVRAGKMRSEASSVRVEAKPERGSPPAGRRPVLHGAPSPLLGGDRARPPSGGDAQCLVCGGSLKLGAGGDRIQSDRGVSLIGCRA